MLRANSCEENIAVSSAKMAASQFGKLGKSDVYMLYKIRTGQKTSDYFTYM